MGKGIQSQWAAVLQNVLEPYAFSDDIFASVMASNTVDQLH